MEEGGELPVAKDGCFQVRIQVHVVFVVPPLYN
jgi:hypothetical protein